MNNTMQVNIIIIIVGTNTNSNSLFFFSLSRRRKCMSFEHLPLISVAAVPGGLDGGKVDGGSGGVT